jgi:hypothetical protein
VAIKKIPYISRSFLNYFNDIDIQGGKNAKQKIFMDAPHPAAGPSASRMRRSTACRARNGSASR